MDSNKKFSDNSLNISPVENSDTLVDNVNTIPAPLDSQVTIPTILKKKHRFPKRLAIFSILTGLIICIPLVLCLFLKIGNQSLVSRVLDGFGNHKMALGIDMLSNGDLGVVDIGNVDINNPQSCENIWDHVKNNSIVDSSIKNYSSDMDLDIRPVNSNYNNTLYFQTYLNPKLDLNNNAAELNLNSSLSIDSSLITLLKTYASALGLSSSLSQISSSPVILNINGKAVLSIDGIYFKLDNSTLKTSSFEKSGTLPYNLYGQNFDLNENQRQGLKEFINTLTIILNSKGRDIVSDDTGKYAMNMLCSFLQDVNVSAPQNVEFGYGDHKIIRNVRAIDILAKTSIDNILQDKIITLMQKLYDDPIFKTYLKSQYRNFGKIYNASNKIFGQNTEGLLPTQSEYEKEVDNVIEQTFGLTGRNSVKVSFTNMKDMSSMTDISTPGYKIDTKTITYIDMESGKLYGTRSIENIKFDSQSIANLDPSIQNILKDGISIKAESFNYKTQGSGIKIDEESLKKDYTLFIQDYLKTDLGKKIINIVGGY